MYVMLRAGRVRRCGASVQCSSKDDNRDGKSGSKGGVGCNGKPSQCSHSGILDAVARAVRGDSSIPVNLRAGKIGYRGPHAEYFTMKTYGPFELRI